MVHLDPAVPDGAVDRSTQEGEQHPSPPMQVRGFTTPFRKAMLASLQQGRILEIPVREGQHVREGDVVTILDMALQVPRTEAARLEAESADRIELARVQMEYARYEFDRVSRLLEDATAASVRETREAKAKLDMATLNHAIARAEHAQAVENYRLQKELLEQHKLRAPFPGCVTARLKEIGETVEEREAIIELCQLDTLTVTLDCPLPLSDRVRPGDRIEVIPMDPRWPPRTGEVTFANPAADAGSQTFKVKLVVSNADGLWAGGLMVMVDFSRRSSAGAVSLSESPIPQSSQPAGAEDLPEKKDTQMTTDSGWRPVVQSVESVKPVNSAAAR